MINNNFTKILNLKSVSAVYLACLTQTYARTAKAKTLFILKARSLRNKRREES
jgi:hypothetical protein